MEAIDLPHIESLGGLSSPELVEILQDFVDGLDQQAAALGSLINEGNRQGLREAAHRLKGAAQMAGFPAVARIAEELEISARDGDTLPEQPAMQSRLSHIAQEAISSWNHALQSKA